MSRVTSLKVAQACGVSQPTVSRILGRHAHLYSPETRAKVIAACDRLGYRPNTAARAIASGRFNAIGFLFRDDGSTVGSSMVYGVNQVLREHDLRLVLAPLHGRKELSQSPAILRELSVDGLLISLMQDVPDDFRRMIKRARMAVAWINAKLEVNAVRPNDHAMAAELTGRLIERGHRRIAYLSYAYDQGHHYSGRDRYDGYASAMRAAGLTPIAIDTGGSASHSDRSGAASRLLAMDRLPTAVVCGNDSLAHPLLYFAARRGLDVPNDLSVAAIMDNERDPMGAELTGVVVPFREIGESAARMLQQRIETNEDQPAQIIQANIHDGRTVGTCRSA